jgi:hypothetical protein
MIIKKEKSLEETVIEFEDEEDEEDLSWMIQDNEQSETELNNNKKLKRKK